MNKQKGNEGKRFTAFCSDLYDSRISFILFEIFNAMTLALSVSCFYHVEIETQYVV